MYAHKTLPKLALIAVAEVIMLTAANGILLQTARA